MKLRVPSLLCCSAVVAALTFLPLMASAQDSPLTGGMQGGPMMGGGMKGEDMMKGCDMMGGGMMGYNGEHMSHMMSMMKEKLSHAADRVSAIKTELKITEAQTPAWNKFAEVLLAASKSMETSMDAMHKQMMASGAGPSLPKKLENHVKIAAGHLANLQAIKIALDPLYASFNDEQKKLADGLRIGPMGAM